MYNNNNNNNNNDNNMARSLRLLFLFTLIYYTSGIRNETSTANESWAYVDVRDGAHMFYWLYKTSSGHRQAPLILWLQGGPGGSSTGFGNFEELGPLDVDQKPRATTWLSAASLLFVDNPVGTGFSYADNPKAFATDVSMVASDMLVVLKQFFMNSDSGKNFQDVPFFIFCESYGGKMTAAISEALYQAVQKKEIHCNFKGLALGDSWISPADSTESWGPYLYVNSLTDMHGLKQIDASAKNVSSLCKAGKWTDATEQWGSTQDVVEEVTHGVNFYNILSWGTNEETKTKISRHQKQNMFERLRGRMLKPLHADKLSALMNGEIRKKLKIIPEKVAWGGQANDVFEHMKEDFMKPVIDTVNRLIQNTSLYVVVYTGQLDLIVATLGTEKWIQTLDVFPYFTNVDRKTLTDPVTKLTSGYVKTLKNFSIYWILSAGHMVPSDNGYTALEMVKQIINYPN